MSSLAAILGLIRSPIGKYAMGAVAVLALLAAVWLSGNSHGHKVEKARQERALRAAVARVAKIDASTAQTAQTIKEATEKTRAVIQWQTHYLTKEVPVYVTAQADLACRIPVGFVRLYDAAARGTEVPASASGSDDADSGLALSAVAETDVANLGAGNEAINEVRAWREWYAREAALMAPK